MKIKSLIFRLANGNYYRIDENNIAEFNIQLKEEEVDFSLFGEDMELQSTTIVDSLLLVVNNYKDIIPLDIEEPYHPEDESIAFIRMIRDNDKTIDAFVNMSDEEYNRKQLNALNGETLFISIENN